MKIKERLFKEFPTPDNRMILQQAQAEIKKYLHYEEEYWRQKIGATWYAEGDRNTRFFHNLLNGLRKRLHVKRLQGAQGDWIEEEAAIAEEAISFYQQQFTQEEEF